MRRPVKGNASEHKGARLALSDGPSNPSVSETHLQTSLL